MRLRWRVIVIALIVFWLWFYLPCLIAAPAPIAITIRPRVTMVGQLVRVKVTVPQHPDNRKFVLEWGVEAEGLYSSSEIQLDGDTPGTRMTYWFEREVGTSGRWKFLARLSRSLGPDAVAIEYVEVGGGF
jgi:hypothetical protein